MLLLDMLVRNVVRHAVQLAQTCCSFGDSVCRICLGAVANLPAHSISFRNLKCVRQPNKILDPSSGLPRRFGRIHKWIAETGMVEKGQELLSLRGVSFYFFAWFVAAAFALTSLRVECTLSACTCRILILPFCHGPVYEPGLVHPKKNPNGRFPPSKPELVDGEPEDVAKRKQDEIAKIDEVRNRSQQWSFHS